MTRQANSSYLMAKGLVLALFLTSYTPIRIACESARSRETTTQAPFGEPVAFITNIAGGHIGEGGATTDAKLSGVTDVLPLDDGGALVADSFNNRIRRIDPHGLIHTIAGTGAPEPGGDEGLALKARLWVPNAIAVGPDGSTYVVERNSSLVRRIDAKGVINTVAGNGDTGFNGDGSPARQTSLSFPRGIAIDRVGNIYIADSGNNRIRRIDAVRGTVSTVGGTGTFGFNGDGISALASQLASPRSIALDLDGSLLICDRSNNRIRRVGRDGIIRTIAGNGTFGFSGDNGPATSANLRSPNGITVDEAGNIYFSDTGNHRVRRIDRGGLITTIVGDGFGRFAGDGNRGTSASLNLPIGLRFDGLGNLWIADLGNGRVRLFSASGTVSTIAGGALGDQNQALVASFAFPFDVVRDRNDAILVADRDHQRIRRIDPISGIVQTIAGNGSTNITVATGVPSGMSLGDGGAATNASLDTPYGIAVDANNNVFIADSFHSRIRKVDSQTGVITTIAGDGFFGFRGDGASARSASLDEPHGVVVDSAGNIYISDTFSNRVRKVSPDGIIRTIAGNGVGAYSGDGGDARNASLSFPNGIAVDDSGNIFVSDTFNNRIRRIDSRTNVITTIAGSGRPAYSGDGRAATTADLNQPYDVWVINENVFIADTYNHRIRRVDANGMIATVAGVGAGGLGTDDGVGPALDVTYPFAVYGEKNGNILTVDSWNHRIRSVSTVSLPIVREREPNNNLLNANVVPQQCIFTGRFDQSGDLDFVAFGGLMGRLLTIRGIAYEAGSAADLVLTLFSPSGRRLLEVDDSQGNIDPLLSLVIPESGNYLLRVEEFTGRSGPTFDYRLIISLGAALAKDQEPNGTIANAQKLPQKLQMKSA